MSPPAPGDPETTSRMGRTGYPAGFSWATPAPLYASRVPASHPPRHLVMASMHIPPPRIARLLFELDVTCLDDAGEPGEIRLDQRRKLVWGRNEWIHSLAQKPFPDIWPGEDLRHFGSPLVDDRSRRRRRRKQSVPGPQL